MTEEAPALPAGHPQINRPPSAFLCELAMLTWSSG